MRDRWGGIRSFAVQEPQSSWVWPLVAVLSVGALSVMLAVLMVSRKRLQRRWEEFSRQCKRAGLRPGELKVLSHMVSLLRLKDPTTILAVDSVFDMGVHQLMQSRKVAALNEQLHANLAGMLRSTREKLGFRRSDLGDSSGAAVMSSRDIRAGSKLTILATDGGEPCEVELFYSDESHFMIQSDQPLAAAAGDSLVLRYSTQLSLWEFDAPVQEAQGVRLKLGHSFQVRLINRRRFPRVPTDAPAYVAPFTFARSEMATHELPFQPARLVEIAGMGIVFATELKPAVGDRLLVVMEFENEALVKGLAKVRRVDAGEQDGPVNVAMELTGMTDDEISEMVRQTNLAAKRQAARQEAQSQQPDLQEAPA